MLAGMSDDSNNVVDEVAMAMVHTKTIPCVVSLRLIYYIFNFLISTCFCVVEIGTRWT